MSLCQQVSGSQEVCLVMYSKGQALCRNWPACVSLHGLFSAGRAMQISGTSVCKWPPQCCCVSLNGCCQSQEQPHQEVQLLIPVQDPLPALLYICGGAQQPAWPLHIFTVLP